MGLLGSRRRGPPAGRRLRASTRQGTRLRRCPVFRPGGLLSSSRSRRVRGVVRPAPRQRGAAPGFLTEPRCVTAAWPRELSGVLNHARRRCRPRSVCPWVPAASSAGRRGGRAESSRGKTKGGGERSRPPGSAPTPRKSEPSERGAWWRGGPCPAPCRTPPQQLSARLSVPHCRPLPSEPRPGEGASVPRSRPPRRVAVSSSTSDAPAATKVA